jgi:hypothetical protein
MSTIETALHELLTALTADGVRIQRRGTKIRIGPHSKITPSIRARVEAMKPLLLEHLHDETSVVKSKGRPPEVSAGVSSVVSVSKPTVQWDRDELIVLGRADIAVDEIPLAAEIKQHFADLGARVVSARRAAPLATEMRCRAAKLVRAARRLDVRRGFVLRDAWRERIAICCLDGGLSQNEAEKIALDEVLEICKGWKL